MNQNFCTEDATVITTSTANTNFPASNLKHPFRSKRWRSTGVTSEWVVFDLSTTEAIDSVVLMWSKEDGILLSNTATVTIQANATNVWTSPAVSQVLTINNTYELASYYFTSAQNYRYWRVLITDPGNPNGFLELGVCWLGKGLVIDNAQNGFTFQLVDTSKLSVTPFGNVYVDEYPILALMSFSYQYLSYSMMQILENAYRTNGNRDPVMVCLDAEGATFDKDHYTVYGHFGNDFTTTHVVYNILNSPTIHISELA
jgi:hypothetical protein